MTTTISVRELHQQFSKIAKELAKGKSFRVVRHGKLVAGIVPPAEATFDGKEFLRALLPFQFKGGDRKLSQTVDKIVYGL